MEQQETINKYVQSINVMSNVSGILEAVRLHCYSNKDMVAVCLLEKALQNINHILGVKNELINFERLNINNNAITNIIQEVQQAKQEESINFAKTILKTEQPKQENKTKTINEYGVTTNLIDKTQEYTFKNSTLLNNMKYDKTTKDLIVTFLKNGRTYKYKKMPYEEFETLYLLDNNNGHAGSYFSRNIVKNWKQGQYEEIETLLG